MSNCMSFKFCEQFGLIHITEPNTIKLFIPDNYFNTGCKYYKKEKQTNRKTNL